MANDKTKIIREPVDVYIAGTGQGLSVGGWFLVGWCEGGSIKVSAKDRAVVELHNGGGFHLATTWLFEAAALETTIDKRSALVLFETADIDILLVKRLNRTTATRFSNMTLIWEPDFVFSDKTPKKLKIEATRTALKYSDMITEETGLSGF